MKKHLAWMSVVQDLNLKQDVFSAFGFLNDEKDKKDDQIKF